MNNQRTTGVLGSANAEPATGGQQAAAAQRAEGDGRQVADQQADGQQAAAGNRQAASDQPASGQQPTSQPPTSQPPTSQQATALFVSAFFDELARWGVRETVISPGSRSTALTMTAFEMSRRFPERMRVYVDVDERGASFFALGLAKASGRPVALVCTSGTALANYYPAVMEAETSRVPLVVLSGDRPLRLQGFGAPQTVDQVKAYGDHVRSFRQMTMPGAAPRDVAFARQAAREACLSALGPGADVPPAAAEDAADAVRAAGAAGVAGSMAAAAADAPDLAGAAAAACMPLTHASATCDAAPAAPAAREGVVAARGCRHMAGPVQVNFQLDEPLTPDFAVEGLFEAGRSHGFSFCRLGVEGRLDAKALQQVGELLQGGRTLVLAGEGTCETEAEAREVLAWARRRSLPLLADPLSGLRGFADEAVIDNYDNVFGDAACPLPDVVVRFGRYPISKHCTQRLAAARPLNVVVDVAQTRDFNLATDLFAACTPLEFVRSMEQAGMRNVPGQGGGFEGGAEGGPVGSAATPGSSALPTEAQRQFARQWQALNARARTRICAVLQAQPDVEGGYVQALLDMAPEGSCLFSANSMSVRALDTFYVKQDKRLAVLCNRGQNGIDGTVSTALGAAQHFVQTTFLTGDFTMLHDLNALALQRELLVHHGGDAARSVVIVLLNNNGGGIFDMLPQKSDDAYFERLFLVPQDVRFADAASAFGVPYRAVETVAAFREAYAGALGTPGISLIEVKLPLAGVTSRYAPYQGL